VKRSASSYVFATVAPDKTKPTASPSLFPLGSSGASSATFPGTADRVHAVDLIALNDSRATGSVPRAADFPGGCVELAERAGPRTARG
jgi:hypothetical protein